MMSQPKNTLMEGELVSVEQLLLCHRDEPVREAATVDVCLIANENDPPRTPCHRPHALREKLENEHERNERRERLRKIENFS